MLGEDASTGDEWFYNAPGDSPPPALPAAAGERPPRAYRVTVIARSTDEVDAVARWRRPAAEDRPAASERDVYRRRVLSATVEVRNLRGSP